MYYPEDIEYGIRNEIRSDNPARNKLPQRTFRTRLNPMYNAINSDKMIS